VVSGQLTAKTRAVAVAPVIRFLSYGGYTPPKSPKIFNPCWLDLDQVCKIFIPDGLDMSISGINNLLVKCEGPASWPGLFGFAYCFNYTRWRETTMPSIFRREVIDGVEVMGILEGGGA
jgi:hypothetical protein